MSGTDPGPGPRLPADTQVDEPKPAERKEPASGVSRAVREVPADVLDELDEDLGGRPKVHMIETAETHGENGARFATVGSPAAREQVKTQPNAKILVASTTVPPSGPLDGKALQREAAARMKAIVDDAEERARRRAPTEIDTREKKRRLSMTFWGLLIGAIVIALLVGGMAIHKCAQEAKTPTGAPSTSSGPTPTAPTLVVPSATSVSTPTATLVSPPPSSTAPVPSATVKAKPGHTGPVTTAAPGVSTTSAPPAPSAPVPPASSPAPRATNPNVPIF